MAHCTVFDWQLALDNEVTQLLVLDTASGATGIGKVAGKVIN